VSANLKELLKLFNIYQKLSYIFMYHSVYISEVFFVYVSYIFISSQPGFISAINLSLLTR